MKQISRSSEEQQFINSRNRYVQQISERKRFYDEISERVNFAMGKAINNYIRLGVPENSFDKLDFILLPRLPEYLIRSGFHSFRLRSIGLYSQNVPLVQTSVLQLREKYNFSTISLSESLIRGFVFSDKTTSNSLPSSFDTSKLNEVVSHELAHHVYFSGHTNISRVAKLPVHHVFREAFPTFIGLILSAAESKNTRQIQIDRIKNWVERLDSFMKYMDRFIPVGDDRPELGSMLGYMLGASAALEVINQKRGSQLEILKMMLRGETKMSTLVSKMVKFAEKNNMMSDKSVNFFNFYMRNADISMGDRKYFPWPFRLAMQFANSLLPDTILKNTMSLQRK